MSRDRVFVSVPVIVVVSLGAKLAQTEGECQIVHGLGTVTLLHICFLLSQSCCVQSRWLKVATKQSFICHGSGALLSAIASAAAAAVAEKRAGMAIRQEMAVSLQRVREEMHTTINDRLDAVSSISSAMQRLSAGLAETAKPNRISDLIPQSWDGKP